MNNNTPTYENATEREWMRGYEDGRNAANEEFNRGYEDGKNG